MSQPFAETLPRIDAERPALHPELAAKLEAAMQSPEVQAAMTLPLPKDCDHESTLVMVPFLHGIGSFPVWCDIAFTGRIVVRIAFEEGWREKTEANGYPYGELWVESLLSGLANREFWRRHG